MRIIFKLIICFFILLFFSQFRLEKSLFYAEEYLIIKEYLEDYLFKNLKSNFEMSINEFGSNNSARNEGKSSTNNKGLNQANRNGNRKSNQNDLKNELKRIDLSRRQYELGFVHEQRKIITKIANKLIRSTSNLDVIFKKKPPTSSSALQSNSFFNRRISTQYPMKNFPASSGAQSAAPPTGSLKRGITFVGFSSTKNDPPNTQPRPITTILAGSTANLVKPDADSLKKNVKWNVAETQQHPPAAVRNRRQSISSQQAVKSRTSMYDLNKKFDELRLKYPDKEAYVLLPLLISSNRRSNTEIRRTRNNYDYIVNENSRKINDYKKQFIDLIEREDSGFFSYKDSKGQPVCLGYDNYTKRLDATSARTPRPKSNKKKQFLREEHYFSSFPTVNDQPTVSLESKNTPVDVETILKRARRSSSAKSATRPKSSKYPLNDSNWKQANSSTISTNESTLHVEDDAILMQKKYDDENKLCDDTFKAQNIRSLTFKPITTY